MSLHKGRWLTMAVVTRCTLVSVCVCFAAHFLSQQQVQCAKALSRNSEVGLNYANFVRQLFHYLNVSQVGSSSVATPRECGRDCADVVTCFSFNVAANPDIDDRLLCELLASDKYNSSDKFQANPLFHHYSIHTPCSNNPCDNGGKCIALYYHDDFNCTCPGYKGKKCELDIDECQENSDNCSTNAMCRNTKGGFNCTCNAGFQGDGVDCTDGKSTCQPIGVRYTNKIPDSSMTASSDAGKNNLPHYGRLYGRRGHTCWAPSTKDDKSDYLQIDLGSEYVVCAVETQGSYQDRFICTTHYKLSVSLDDARWSFYQENKVDKIFPGNSPQKPQVKNQLEPPVDARFVRFYPTAYNLYPVLRVEVYVMM